MALVFGCSTHSRHRLYEQKIQLASRSDISHRVHLDPHEVGSFTVNLDIFEPTAPIASSLWALRAVERRL